MPPSTKKSILLFYNISSSIATVKVKKERKTAINNKINKKFDIFSLQNVICVLYYISIFISTRETARNILGNLL